MARNCFEQGRIIFIFERDEVISNIGEPVQIRFSQEFIWVPQVIETAALQSQLLQGVKRGSEQVADIARMFKDTGKSCTTQAGCAYRY